MNASPPGTRPLVIAHRAGNELAALRQAEDVRADVVEADVWLFRGRLEVRHRKTLGPLPILWDRWELTAGWGPRLTLDTLLAVARPHTRLMLDLKGRGRQLPPAVFSACRRHRPGRPVWVCSRNWNLLAPFRHCPEVTVLHSVGSAAQLRAVLPHLSHWTQRAISIHQRLLNARVIAELKEQTELLVSWPVQSVTQATALHRWGVDGVIVDDPAVVWALTGDALPRPWTRVSGANHAP
jgi:glycerophosphoryl diester phosphodiesterase